MNLIRTLSRVVAFEEESSFISRGQFCVAFDYDRSFATVGFVYDENYLLLKW